MSQLEQLELLGSSGFSQPHPNSDTPSQVLHPCPAVSANGHDSQLPAHRPQCVPGLQQESSGREGGGRAGDIQAVGRLMVQLFRGRMIHHGASDHRQAATS